MSRQLLSIALTFSLAGVVAADDLYADKDPLTLIPTDAAAFAQIRVRRLLDSPVGRQIAEKLPKELAKFDEALTQFLGLKLDDVESVTYVWPKWNVPDSSPAIVIVTRKPYEREKTENILSKHGMAAADEPREKLLNAKNLRPSVLGATYFFGPDMIVLSRKPREIAAFVELFNRKTKHGPLEPTTRQATREHSIVAGMYGDPHVPWFLPLAYESLKPMGEATSIGVVVLIKDNIQARMVAEFPPGMAADGRDSLGSLQGLAPTMTKDPPVSWPFWRIVPELAKNSRFLVDGSMVRMLCELPPPMVSAIIDKMAGIEKPLAEKKKGSGTPASKGEVGKDEKKKSD
jgi:hypothetical protein